MSTPQIPDDKLIKRNRIGRWAVLIGSAALMPSVSALLVGGIVHVAEGNDLATMIGAVVGATIGGVGFMAVRHRFFVFNNSTGIFSTIDMLRSVLNLGNINVTYGPGGPYVAYPWEKRLGENNISVKMAAQNFSFEVQTADGSIKGKGSFRLQPDYTMPIEFLTGVAEVAGDIQSLIIAGITEYMAALETEKALKSIPELNKYLSKKFVAKKKKTEIEKLFGIHLVDITVEELATTDDVKTTMAALAESRILAKGVAILLGKDTAEEVQAALAAGTISQEQYDNARKDFLLMSKQYEDMNISRFEIDLGGVKKDTAEALLAFMNQIPPAAMTALAVQAGSKSKGKTK